VRLILSRKGFDSSAGGCPNPLLPDGSLLALPIPDAQSPIRYHEIQVEGYDISQLVDDLTGGRLGPDDRVHLDPDLTACAYPRADQWRPLLGQMGAAQSHLRNEGVGEGDLFLFFALFRPVEHRPSGWRFIPGSRPVHALWGWLQVDSVLDLNESEFPASHWTAYHPHRHGDRGAINALYLSRPQLSFADLPGAGVFPTFRPVYQLTAPTARRVTDWQLPEAFYPAPGTDPLSYHRNRDRWQRDDQGCRLRSAARGQEFVLDLEAYPGVWDWLADVLAVPDTRENARQA